MFTVKTHIIQQKQQVPFSVVNFKPNKIQNTWIHILEHNWVGLSKIKKYIWPKPTNNWHSIELYMIPVVWLQLKMSWEHVIFLNGS